MLQIIIGTFILSEGVVALVWLGNDRWFPAQVLRVLRVLAGVILILVGLGLVL